MATYNFKRLMGSVSYGAVRLTTATAPALLRGSTGMNAGEVNRLAARGAVLLVYQCSTSALRANGFGEFDEPRCVMTTLRGRRLAGTLSTHSAFCGTVKFPPFVPSAVQTSDDTLAGFDFVRRRVCVLCGEVLTGTSDRAYCPACYAKKMRTRWGYHEHHEAFAFQPPRARVLDRKKHLHLGFEWELNVGENEAETDCVGLCTAISKAVDGEEPSLFYFRFERDGSLVNSGCECISQAYTYGAHSRMREKLRAAAKAAEARGAWTDEHCGLHIHIDRRFFGGRSRDAAAKIGYLVAAFQREFVALSGRTDRGYCSPSGIVKSDGIFTADGKLAARGHSGEVNVSGANTIEVRIYGGTMDADRVLAYLDLTRALALIARAVSYDALENFTFGRIGRYLKDPARTIPALREAGLPQADADALDANVTAEQRRAN